MQMSLDAAMGHTFSVAEFAGLVNELLDHTFPHDLWIQGEVRNLNRAASGHVYFTLVDPTDDAGRSADAQLRVVLFEQTKHQVNAQIKRTGNGMRIEDGVAIRVRGVPGFFAPRGELNLRMTGIDPAYTLGQLTASRDRLLQMLADEGLLRRNAALPVGPAPMRIGLVTAAGSAAHADFMHELEGSGFAFAVTLASCTVQGPAAPATIAGAIAACQRPGIDVIAVVRGGGARTDLVAFDDEQVARAIADSGIPVFTGIGHEIDRAVADDVAHTALKTPTACAAHLVGLAADADRRAADLWQAITTAAAGRLAHHDSQLTSAAARAGERTSTVLTHADRTAVAAAQRVQDLASARLGGAAHRLAGHAATARLQARHRLSVATADTQRATSRLDAAAGRRLDAADRHLDQAATTVRLLDPARVLARGWTITTTADGTVIRSSADAPAGTRLTTRVADGVISSTVDDEPEASS